MFNPSNSAFTHQPTVSDSAELAVLVVFWDQGKLLAEVYPAFSEDPVPFDNVLDAVRYHKGLVEEFKLEGVYPADYKSLFYKMGNLQANQKLEKSLDQK